ncbi:MAG: uracil-DNA glycosylase [Solirubrobacteraceae bacterium]
MPAEEDRREALEALREQAQTCVRCPQLAAARHTVVFGAGNPNADLMFIGEAPGASEDELGLPFVGRSGKLLARLLAEIGLEREDVFIQNVLCCRPPGNRDPLPAEIDNCRSWLMEKIRLVEPRVVCTLGNFATKLLRGEPVGITRLHGQPEVREVGGRVVRLYPLFHPAAALYTPSNVELLRADVARIPALLALDPPAQPGLADPDPAPVPEAGAVDELVATGQLGLF